MFFFPQQALCWHTLVAFLKGCCYKDRQNFNNNVKQRDLKRNQKKSGRRKGWYSVWSSYRAVRDLRYLRETAAFYSLYSNGNLLCSKDGGTQTCLVHFTVKLHPHYKCLCFGFGFWFLCCCFFFFPPETCWHIIKSSVGNSTGGYFLSRAWWEHTA